MDFLDQVAQMDVFSQPNFITYAIPGFLLLMFVEIGYSYFRKKKYYRLNDSINDLTMGIYSRISGVFLYGGLLFAYFQLYEYLYRAGLTITTVGMDSVFGWLACFLVVDHQYYWFHRMSHQVAFIWGSHEPHHQSEEYNLAVALRQGAFQGIFSWPFYLPIALLGFPPFMFFACSQINTIYQFWIHTRAVKKLGPLEYILNTPSHHRVHHGINPKYIDKNHAGTLIVWDVIYGTFQPEEEEPVYGTVKPLANFNPIWANVQYWVGLAKLSARAESFRDKWNIWWNKPGWKPENMGGPHPIPEVDAASFKKYDPPLPPGLKLYALVHFIAGLGMFLYMLGSYKPADGFTPTITILGALSVWTLLAIGVLLDRKLWGLPLEFARLFVLYALTVALLLDAAAYLWIGVATVVLFLFAEWLWRYRSAYQSKSSEPTGGALAQ